MNSVYYIIIPFYAYWIFVIATKVTIWEVLWKRNFTDSIMNNTSGILTHIIYLLSSVYFAEGTTAT
ncbi:hypothetical protein CC78DRAFT_380544 [Lojkania enalia]|uniref:Uncharacterized protein n=1 Tax=Lojkania enalia TaxID=147567 RepID=A0A9P4K315_9PLEO|nr:hypothetical protein CC78DRAFT_380544 [Didymosphaeria enalia]